MIALVSDLHSNLEALNVALEHIASQGIHEILCLGDIIGYGPNPRECIQKAVEFQLNLRGNHEEAVLYYADDFNVNAKKAINWTRDQLNSRQHDREENYRTWDFLGSLELERRDGSTLYVHGSPRVPTREYVLPRDVGDPEKLSEIFSMIDKVCFIGHTHYPGVFTDDFQFRGLKELEHVYRIEASKKALINIGSVGQPRDGDNRVSYATWDGETVRWHRLEYDYATTMQKIIDTGELPVYLANRLKEGV